MNLRGTCVLCAATFAWLAPVALQSPRAASPEQEVMLEKLAAAQKVLHALATEDFDLIRRNAERLGSFGEHPAVRASPAAARLSQTFIRETKRMAEAARQRNLGRSTDAFLAVTRSCIDCHTAVRGKRASFELPSGGGFAAVHFSR